MRMAGVGGQGIITMGAVFGRAAALIENKEAVLTEAYGPEITGGFAIADLIITDGQITYPKVDHPDVLVLMSNDAWARDRQLAKPDAYILYDKDLVNTADITDSEKIISVPAAEIADELGRRVVANVVMMGVVREVSNVVSREALEEALLTRVPKGTEELNKTALHRGFEYGEKIIEGN